MTSPTAAHGRTARSRAATQGLLAVAILATLANHATYTLHFEAAPAGFAVAPLALHSGLAVANSARGVLAAGGARAGAAAARPGRAAVTQARAATEDLAGKVALVTGASRGIGAAIADKLAAAGATVVGTATSDSGAEAITARFSSGGLKGKGMKLDVVDTAEVDAVLKAITDEYGAPDILINNAGITRDTLMLRMKEPDWDAVIDTNLNSVYRVTKAAIKAMTKKRWGRVISISSVVGSMGNAGQANYAAAKAGMEGFTRALGREVGSRSITVNAVAPGFIKSDMTDGLKEEWKAKLLESVPAGRLGTPEEVAEAVLFLASPSSAYITGQTLHVNGGMYM